MDLQKGRKVDWASVKLCDLLFLSLSLRSFLNYVCRLSDWWIKDHHYSCCYVKVHRIHRSVLLCWYDYACNNTESWILVNPYQVAKLIYRLKYQCNIIPGQTVLLQKLLAMNVVAQPLHSLLKDYQNLVNTNYICKLLLLMLCTIKLLLNYGDPTDQWPPKSPVVNCPAELLLTQGHSFF